MADLKYIPQLKLYYNEQTNEYVNKHGQVIDYNDIHLSHDEDEDDNHEKTSTSLFSLDKMHVSISTLVQVIALTIAVYTQYSGIMDKISDDATQLKLYKAATDEKLANMQTMQNEIAKIHAELALQDDMIKAMQIRLASSKK